MQITSATSTSPNANPAADTEATSAQLLGQADFIKLLVTQMTSQDPLKPMDNQDMLAQMVQFSTLQQNTSLQSELARMQTSQVLTQANLLLGRQVTLQADSSTVTEGVVSGIDLTSGTPQIIVNGEAYDLRQVLAISNPTPSNPSP